jgi:hypothetical protein
MNTFLICNFHWELLKADLMHLKLPEQTEIPIFYWIYKKQSLLIAKFLRVKDTLIWLNLYILCSIKDHYRLICLFPFFIYQILVLVNIITNLQGQLRVFYWIKLIKVDISKNNKVAHMQYFNF